MSTTEQDRVLIVDDNSICRNMLAEWVGDLGYTVIAADNGQAAFITLREWPRRVGWLYCRARLPGMIDGWILADEYHDMHPKRAAVISFDHARTSSQGHIILAQPTPMKILDTLRQVIDRCRLEDAERPYPCHRHEAA
jgi:CheY-like chemotaxis protein